MLLKSLVSPRDRDPRAWDSPGRKLLVSSSLLDFLSVGYLFPIGNFYAIENFFEADRDLARSLKLRELRSFTHVKTSNVAVRKSNVFAAVAIKKPGFIDEFVHLVARIDKAL